MESVAESDDVCVCGGGHLISWYMGTRAPKKGPKNQAQAIQKDKRGEDRILDCNSL